MVQSSTGFISSIKVEEEVKVLFKGGLLAEQVVLAHPMNKSQKGKGQSQNAKGSREFRLCVRNPKKTRGRHRRDEEAIRGGSARTKIGSEGKEQQRKSRRRCPKTTVNAGNASVAYKTCG